MCIQTALQSKIAELTDNGDTILRFLADTAHGKIPAAKLCHRLDAAKTLAKYGLPQPDDITKFPSPIKGKGQDGGENTVRPEPVEGPVEDLQKPPLPQGEGWGEGEQDKESPPSISVLRPTLRDIVAYSVARYIRERTDGGETILNALTDIMRGGSYSRFDRDFGNPPLVKPHQRLAAAKELMGRAMGESRPPRRESSQFDADAPLDENDPINSRFARLVRDRTNNGIDAAETLVRIVENSHDEDEWLPAHRFAASKELLHRAYDLNYDAVTWKEIEAYRRATEDSEEHKRVELESARHKSRLSELIREFDEACAADDEDAMKAAEKKYADYVKYGDEGNPDDPIDYEGIGPDDPDPTVDFYRPGLNKEDQAKFDRQVARHHAEKKNAPRPNTAAASIRAPKLTIPLHNRSP